MQLHDALPDWQEVHVWFVELEADMATLETCRQSLSADERARASQFRVEHLKTTFTLSRGILRALLGRYLAVAPSRLGFAYGPRGKPRLAFPEIPLQFNLAHSGKFAIYAFAVGCEVGVDIEHIESVRDLEKIVSRFFSREEYEEWLALDASLRNESFFRCWTRKEAYIKAVGEGLSMPLNSFRVGFCPEVPVLLDYIAGDPAAAEKWLLYSLTPADGYIGSLALPDPLRAVAILPQLTAAAVLDLVRGPGPFPPARKEFIPPLANTRSPKEK